MSEAVPTPTSTRPSTSLPPRTSVALSLSGAINHLDFPTGDRAELRRWTPGEVPPLAYWRLAADRIPADLHVGRDDRNWAFYVHAVALLAPEGHAPGVSIGDALRRTRYHEKRVARLLGADEGDAFRSALLQAVRWLASHRQGVDTVELAGAFRFGGTDPTRERIARGYYK
jgi:CRISPR system Cascade subunit CasB